MAAAVEAMPPPAPCWGSPRMPAADRELTAADDDVVSVKDDDLGDPEEYELVSPPPPPPFSWLLPSPTADEVAADETDGEDADVVAETGGVGDGMWLCVRLEPMAPEAAGVELDVDVKVLLFRGDICAREHIVSTM